MTERTLVATLFPESEQLARNSATGTGGVNGYDPVRPDLPVSIPFRNKWQEAALVEVHATVTGDGAGWEIDCVPPFIFKVTVGLVRQ